jgi:hypothetical protein
MERRNATIKRYGSRDFGVTVMLTEKKKVLGRMRN